MSALTCMLAKVAQFVAFLHIRNISALQVARHAKALPTIAPGQELYTSASSEAGLVLMLVLPCHTCNIIGSLINLSAVV